MVTSDVAAMAVPERSYRQRMDALERANRVRSARARLKKRMKDREVSADEVMLSPAPYVASMKVVDLLLAAPKIGRVKANKLLVRSRMSPSKTLGGMSERQRRELAVLVQRR